jgi:hypothetical protein
LAPRKIDITIKKEKERINKLKNGKKEKKTFT